MTPAMLDVRNLTTELVGPDNSIRLIDDVNLRLDAGEIMGLVGESGSGKSLTGLSIMGLLDPPVRVAHSQILFKGEDLRRMDDERLRRIRGDRIAMIFQDPMSTLNPVLRIDTQMIETIKAHEKISTAAARVRARDALGKVGIPSPDERLKAYPVSYTHLTLPTTPYV